MQKLVHRLAVPVVQSGRSSLHWVLCLALLTGGVLPGCTTLHYRSSAILTAMGAAFEALNLPIPARDDVLGIVGLSLDQGIMRLVPEAAQPTREPEPAGAD